MRRCRPPRRSRRSSPSPDRVRRVGQLRRDVGPVHREVDRRAGRAGGVSSVAVKPTGDPVAALPCLKLLEGHLGAGVGLRAASARDLVDGVARATYRQPSGPTPTGWFSGEPVAPPPPLAITVGVIGGFWVRSIRYTLPLLSATSTRSRVLASPSRRRRSRPRSSSSAASPTP